MRTAVLAARDARERELRRFLAATPGGSVLLISCNIPGPDKHRPGLARLLQTALAALGEPLALRQHRSGRDVLGPFHLASTGLAPATAKAAAMAVEAGPGARLLDVDVYAPDGLQVDRASLGLGPRPCLLCPEDARECIRLQRHGVPELLAKVTALLQPFTPAPALPAPAQLAAALAQGALRELNVTPKPGLVDQLDCGSHTDLSYAGMRRSAELLPEYFAELLRLSALGRPLAEFVQAGRDAEQRMTRAIQSNAHKGYLFLSGLVLMAACEGGELRAEIARLGSACFAQSGAQASHGAHIRQQLGLGGIRAEVERGLPALFEQGWPRYQEALAAGWGAEEAGYYLMAVLMQHVEDTTAIHRCGLAGLARLRQDGAGLQRLLEAGQDPRPRLASLNRDYRRTGLTMGGVADMMALAFALRPD